MASNWDYVIRHIQNGLKNPKQVAIWKSSTDGSKAFSRGEAQYLASQMESITNKNSAATAIEAAFRLAAFLPDLFSDLAPSSTEENGAEKKYAPVTGGLGNALALRLEGRADPNTQANNTIKMWSSATREMMASQHIPTLARFVDSKDKRGMFRLSDIMEILYKWDYKRVDYLSNIASEYLLRANTPSK